MKTIKLRIISILSVVMMLTELYGTCATEVDMGNNKIINVADPQASGDVVNMHFLKKTLIEGYVRDDIKEIVSQVSTGLMWQDDVDAQTVQKRWLNAGNTFTCLGNGTNCENTIGNTAASYCSNLTLGGYSDWRLPSIVELKSIVKTAVSNPSISNVFQNISSNTNNNYWSSTSVDALPSFASSVFFMSGTKVNIRKDTLLYVRCVRGGQ